MDGSYSGYIGIQVTLHTKLSRPGIEMSNDLCINLARATKAW